MKATIAVTIRVSFLSGLMIWLWVACSGGGGEGMGSAPPTPIEVDPPMVVGSVGNFTLFDDGTALDERTQLLWNMEDFRLMEGKAPANYEAAMQWVRQRNTEQFKGYNDWRLPTRSECDDIYEPDSPARSYRDEPVGYPAAFVDGGGEWYWTSDIAEYGSPADHIHRAWTYNFVTRETESRYIAPTHHGHRDFREETGSIRLVRDDGP